MRQLFLSMLCGLMLFPGPARSQTLGEGFDEGEYEDAVPETGFTMSMTVEGIEKPFPVVALSGTEAVSKVYGYSINAVASNPDAVKTLFGRPAYVTLRQDGVVLRYVSGYISQTWMDDDPGMGASAFSVHLVPFLHLLSNAASGEVFLDASYPETVEKILARYEQKWAKHEFRLQRTYPKRSHMIQYRETDLNFIQHQLEQVGIFYAFHHAPDGNTLVMTDANTELRSKGAQTTVSIVLSRQSERLSTGSYTLIDYDRKTPSSDIYSATRAAESFPFSDTFRIVDWPGEFENQDQAELTTQYRIEEERSQVLQYTGSTENCSVLPGQIVAAEWDGKQVDLFVTETTVSASYDCTVSITAIPAAVKFAPERRTPVPVISGHQIAKVKPAKAGDPSDKVRVGFYWDVRDKSSPGLLVPKAAGMDPRVGQDVVVTFGEGDPAQAMVVATLNDGLGWSVIDIVQTVALALSFFGLGALWLRKGRSHDAA